MKIGTWAADPAARGVGVLQVRKLADGAAAFYYRYTAPDGERVRLPIGTAIDLRNARQVAAELSRRYQSGDRDLRAVMEAEQREEQRKREDAERAAEAKSKHTLGVLLTAYGEQLQRDGKPSARAVQAALTRHVANVWPKLWRTPAAEITMDDLLAVIARVVKHGKLREAGKLRSYLRAAYAAAIRARQDARGSQALRDLRIKGNPARELVTIEGSNRARDRALSLAELRAYWQRIQALPTSYGALLRFHLLTGGQRIEQLARLKLGDRDNENKAVRLLDTKGRRKQPRMHIVPLLPAADAALIDLQGGALGLYLFTATAGESGASHSTLTPHIKAVVAAMQEAGELENGPFTLGDLRRTVETRLSSAGVPKEHRAQLQSHGLGGVQDRHYDRHEYLNEKRAALETLHRILTGHTASVTNIRKRKQS